MYVTFAADRRGITKPRSDLLDRRFDVLFRPRLAVKLLEFLQRQGGKNGPVPGTEILRGDVFPADLPEIGIYIRGRHVACLTLLIKILKQLLPWQLLAGANDLGDPPVVYTEPPNFATFSLEVEA